jgi:hypothetical protein
MAKSKKLTFESDEKVSIKGAMFHILKLKNGNMMVRALGGYDMEGAKMVLRNPVLESEKQPSSSRWSSKDDSEAQAEE